MEKLRDAKKIKWIESYTPKTEFLRNQFEAVIGPGSYKRWEGNEVGGPGKWYVVVSPADVHEHKRAKFFAGIRKLPDSWPAGGKYYDTIREAYEYAYDTWGSPKPQDIPPLTAGDLKGISKKIDAWKEEHAEDHENKTSFVLFDVFRIKTAMAKKAVEKSSLFFDIKRFAPILETIDLKNSDDSDILYQGILALSSFKTRDKVEAMIANNEDINADMAKTVIPGAVNVFPWKKENVGLANPAYEEITNTPQSVSETGLMVDNFFDVAALICTIGRMKRENCVREFLEVVGKLKDSEEAKSIDRRFYRSNFEEAILSAWQKYKFNVANLEKCYDFKYYMFDLYLNSLKEGETGIDFDKFKEKFETDKEFAAKWTLEKKDYPIRMFVEYGRRDSSAGYWLACPYTSQRRWNKRVTINESAFIPDKFGLCEMDYAILNGVGLERPKVIDEEFAKKGKAKLLELGSIPDQIKDFFKTGEVKGSGIKGKSLLGRARTAREFSFVIDKLRKHILPGNENIIKGLFNAFTGWSMFIGGTEQKTKSDFHQEIKAKANGSMYGGRKAISDMTSRESIVGLLQQESGTIFSLRPVPSVSLISSLSKLSGINEKNSPMIQAFIEKIKALGEDVSVSFETAVRLSEESGLKGILTKEDVLFLFGEALQSGSEIVKKFKPVGSATITFSTRLSVKISGKTANLITQNGLVEYLDKNVKSRFNAYVEGLGGASGMSFDEFRAKEMEILSPKQRAILQYSEGKGWLRVNALLDRVEGDSVPRMVATRILKDQVEIIDGVSIRIFSDKDIKSFLNEYKKKTSSSSFLDFKKDLEEGDVTTSVFTNGDGLVMSRLTLTDYFYWKVMMNRFKHVYNLAEENPQLYEDILRCYFVPDDPEIAAQIDAIGAVKFISNGEEVIEDALGNVLFFNGVIKARKDDGSTYVPKEKIDTVFSSSPEENAEQIESVMRKYFKDKKKRKGYRLLSSFTSKHQPSKLHHPQLAFGKGSKDEGRDLSSALKQLSSVQQKVMIEVVRDMVADFDPADPHTGTKMIKDPTNEGESLSVAQTELATNIREALKIGVQLKCFNAINLAFNKFSRKTGQSIPYTVKNYLEKYNQQISPSVVTSKMSSALGYNVLLKAPTGSKEDFLNVTGDFDVTENASLAAIVLNSFFVQHCRRLAKCKGVPEVFNVSQKEESENEKKFMINSLHLSVCHYLKTTSDSPEIQNKNIIKIQNTFSVASNASSLLRLAVARAYPLRTGTIPLMYDPYISVDAKGERAKVWYNMANVDGWKARSILVTANTLTNWIHKSIPGKDSPKMTVEILSQILKCSSVEAEDILQSTISAKQSFEVLSAENIFNVYDMEKFQGIVEAEAESVSETETKEVIVGGATDKDDEDGSAPVADTGKVDVGNTNTDISEQAPGISPLVSDVVPLAPDAATVADAAVKVGSEEEAKKAAEQEVIDAEENLVPEGDTVNLQEGEDVDENDPKYIIKPVLPEETATVAPVAAPEVIAPVETEKPPVAIEEPAVPSPQSGVGLPPPKKRPGKATVKDYEVVQTPPTAAPVQVPQVVPAEPSMIGGGGSNGAPLPPRRQKKASLLGLVRVAKTLIRKGEYKKAEAINKFVKLQLSGNIPSSEVRKLAIKTLSNLLSVSKKLQKEGKHEDANEINQIVKNHLERLG